MTTVQFIRARVSEQDKVSIDDIIQEVMTALRSVSTIQSFSIGNEIEDKDVLQMTIQISNPLNSPAPVDLLNSLQKLTTMPPTLFHATFNNPPFAPFSGPATAPLVEYAQSWFPSSAATPAFKRCIEQDFDKFTNIFEREATGNVGCAYGWIEEELEKEDVKGGKSTSFLVTRGWKSFEDFKTSTTTESSKEAFPILLNWGAPYRLWFVQRRVGSE